jgi:hypothetical protein
MVKNDYDRAVTAMKKLINKFGDWGLTAGFVYTTEEGFLSFYGSEAVGHVIDNHQSEIISHPAFSHKQDEHDDGPDHIPDDAGKMVSRKKPETKKFFGVSIRHAII